MDLTRLLRPEFLVRGAVVAAISAAVIVGALSGLPLALLVVAGAVLIFAVFLLWSSLQSLTGETELTLEEALEMGAPSAEEERKQAVLRALKDLEYERGVGKISEQDYAELAARYRAEAKTLLRQLDEELKPRRQRVEADLQKRLREAGLDNAAAPQAETTESEADEPDESETRPRGLQCTACETVNDEDARFCKGCGEPLATETEATS